MKGFSTRNLKYMRKFAEEYPNVEFVQEPLAQLTWYHNVTLLEKIENREIRLFYIKGAIEHGWSRNIMVMQIERGLYKRQGRAITNFEDKLPSPQSDLAHYTLKDPYIFDFLGIGDTVSPVNKKITKIESKLPKLYCEIKKYCQFPSCVAVYRL